MVELVIRVECYVKGKKINAKKKARDVKECVLNIESLNPRRKNNYTLLVKDKSMFKRVGKVAESKSL